MKTYLKTLARMFKKHVTRLLSIILIVLVSVGFVSGIGSATDKINYSMSDYYSAQNVSDFIVKSTGGGFTDEEIAAVKELYGESNVNTGMSVDVYVTIDGEEQLIRLYFLDEYDNPTVNIAESVETAQSGFAGIRAKSERSDNKIKGLEIGTQVELDFADILLQLADQNGEELDSSYQTMLKNLEPVTVSVEEIVQSPLTFANDGEPSYLNPEDAELPNTVGGVNEMITLDNILYLPSSVIPVYGDIVPEQYKAFLSEETLNEPLLGTGDLYVALSDRSVFAALSVPYKNYLNEQKAALSSRIDAEGVRVITLYDNYSFVSLKSYGEKVMDVGYVVMVAFLFVTALVVLSTMTRLLEEERQQIACLKTIGYSSARIVFKYLLFAMIATGIGGVGSYFVSLGIAKLLYWVFSYSFVMPAMSSHIAMVFYLITFSVIVAATLLATVSAGHKLTGEKPADLLRPKAPRAGRKVIIEKIPLIWNRLSFKYKSTVRNVLRYRYRFLMTVIAVAVSMALVLAGLALLDVCLFGGLESVSVMLVAVVVVVFAGLLTAVVIYTLTNINISERNRELATLMVLGYFDGEVAGYVYREIYIDTVIGILIGYVLSLPLMWFLFDIMEVGTILGVSWFMWLVAPFIVLLFTFLVTILLRRKIVKIDMNESLKAVE